MIRAAIVQAITEANASGDDRFPPFLLDRADAVGEFMDSITTEDDGLDRFLSSHDEQHRNLGLRFVWGGTGSYRCFGCNPDDWDARRLLTEASRPLQGAHRVLQGEDDDDDGFELDIEIGELISDRMVKILEESNSPFFQKIKCLSVTCDGSDYIDYSLCCGEESGFDDDHPECDLKEQETAAPTPAPAPAFCFSDRTTVQTRSRGKIRMHELKLGDEVLTATSKNGAITYEQVYSFGHRNEVVSTEFLQFLPSKLELTPNHLVFKKDQKAPVPASMIQIGDELMNGQVVSQIKRTTRSGVYAPFTFSGELIVNDVVVSSYISLWPDKEGEDYTDGRFMKDLVGHYSHWLSHAYTFPHRVWCGVFASSCFEEEEYYTEDGISMYAYSGYKLMLWFNEMSFPAATFFSLFVSGFCALGTFILACVVGRYAIVRASKKTVA